MSLESRHGSRGFLLGCSSILLFAIIFSAGCSNHSSTTSSAPTPVVENPAPNPINITEASINDVNVACSPCHATPKPSQFPKRLWRFEVEQAYGFMQDSLHNKDGHLLPINYPVAPMESILAYYYRRAPDALPVVANTDQLGQCPVNFKPIPYSFPGEPQAEVSNVSLVHVYDKKRFDVIGCSLVTGSIYLLRPYVTTAQFVKIAQVRNPAHVSVIDINNDGVPDLLIATLGSVNPTNERVGGVILLMGKRDASGNITFVPHAILTNVGRVSDVEPVDAGNGKKDLIVAEFGHHTVGSIMYLRNDTTDWNNPVFTPHVLDSITGAIHVPVFNVTGHGAKDFAAVISQEHEQVFLFLYKSRGVYTKKLIFSGEHPAVGSSGLTLCDLLGHGRSDMLYTSGDLFDPNSLLRPDQGVYWLQSAGGANYKTTKVTSMYGCYHAVAGHFENASTEDIIAVAHVPTKVEPNRVSLKLNAVIFVKVLPNGTFKRYSLEQGSCDHFTCDAGDIFGSGHADFVVGNAVLIGPNSTPNSVAVTLWRNMGPAKHATAAIRNAHSSTRARSA